MTDKDSSDTSRTKVETYIPAYQKKIWRKHAEDLSMSQSEFVKTMVQAGRRGFEAKGAGEIERQNDSSGDTIGPQSTSTDPGGNDLEDRLLDALDDGPCSWDELVERMTEDVVDQLDNVLERLQQENRVRYSGRNGGYTRTEVE
jgi:protoporphyrinogen oxidase